MADKTKKDTCSLSSDVESCDTEIVEYYPDDGSKFSTMVCDKSFEFASDVVSCSEMEV